MEHFSWVNIGKGNNNAKIGVETILQTSYFKGKHKLKLITRIARESKEI